MAPAFAPGPDPSCAGLLPILADAEPRVALGDDRGGRPWTRGALRAEALAVAGGLVGPRKRLAFLLADNGAAAVVALLAVAAAGHAVALVDPGLADDKLDHLVRTYRPDLVLAGDGFDRWDAVTGSDPAAWTRAAALGGALAWVARADGESDEIHPDLLLLLSTSGTTGSAKFVRLSAGAVTSNAGQIAAVLDVDASSVAVAHLPLHYSYGLSVVTSHLAVGGRVFAMTDAVTSPTFWPKVAAAGGTHFPGVPFHYMVLGRLGLGLVPPGVTTFTQAGGNLDVRLQRNVADKVAGHGGRFFVMYGQTEAAPRMTTLPSAQLADKLGSVGVALPGGRLSVVDEGGRERPAGDTGAVIYQGPNVMMGYAESRADLGRGDEAGGRLDTGDIGRLDRDGYLFLSGRTKRFAKVAGLRLGLDEIEQEIGSTCPVACQDEGERIAVYHEDGPEAELKARLKALAVTYKIPPVSFVTRRVEALPRKTSGKVDYARLKEFARV